MPKHAKRVWPFEEGMQGPRFWQREEEFANQHVRTSVEVSELQREFVEQIRELNQQPHDGGIDLSYHMVVAAYDINLKEIYTAHRKAIRAIKDMYPGIR